MAAALALAVCLFQAGVAHSFGGRSVTTRWGGDYGVGQYRQPYSPGFRSFGYGSYKDAIKERNDEVWRATGTVPDKTARVPEAPLDLRWGYTKIYINGTYDTDQLLSLPKFSWEADPDALYTVLIEDNGITIFPVKIIHYMVSNIRGNDMATGDLVASYMPPFTINLNEAGNGLDTRLASQGGDVHEFLVLVYKQKKLISIPEASSCAEDTFTSRFYFHSKLVEEYKLEGPVAGTFFNVGHSRSGWSERLICKYSRCLGSPVPNGVLPGVNDKPECQKVEKTELTPDCEEEEQN